MPVPYFTTCLKCGCSFDHEVAFCPHCSTDEYLLDEPFEEKNRDS